MNEEKIIDYLKEIIQEIEYRHKDGELILVNDTTTDKLYYSIKGLLDLYNKEIQRNKDLEQILELTSKSLDNISYDQMPIAIEELLNLYNKEKEKNKNAIDFINERKKTVNKDMAEGTRLQVGTFMWQVDDLLEILEE